MGTFRQTQGQRSPGGGLFRKPLSTTPEEQTDDSPQGQERLTARLQRHTRTRMHTAFKRLCDNKLRGDLENNLPPSTHLQNV